MKILACSDVHLNLDFVGGLVADSEKADVVIVAGDLANYGGSAESVVEKIAEINVPVILVSGNHDNLLELTLLTQRHENVILLHGEGCCIDGIDFYGLGCEVPKSNAEDWNEWLSEDAAEKMLSDCPDGAVLITHSPAYGHCDLQIYGANEGSEAVLDCIAAKQPKLHLCGHIHNAWGVSSKIGNTPTHNLGSSVNWFEV